MNGLLIVLSGVVGIQMQIAAWLYVAGGHGTVLPSYLVFGPLGMLGDGGPLLAGASLFAIYGAFVAHGRRLGGPFARLGLVVIIHIVTTIIAVVLAFGGALDEEVRTAWLMTVRSPVAGLIMTGAVALNMTLLVIIAVKCERLESLKETQGPKCRGAG